MRTASVKLQVNDNIATLQQGARLLQCIDDDLYRRRIENVFATSIGAHVRHNLGHYRIFLDALETGDIDYSARCRDAAIEVDRTAALTETANICGQLHGVSILRQDLQLQIRNSRGDACATTSTCVSRELEFLLGHTIHHYAIIAIICRLQDVALEEGFGVAPSTLCHLESLKSACVR
ncbi:MAG: hypothetical protein RQ736_11225 [Thiogranum sp.]|nr:hypothetical protein [Thiogranum sp.]